MITLDLVFSDGGWADETDAGAVLSLSSLLVDRSTSFPSSAFKLPMAEISLQVEPQLHLEEVRCDLESLDYTAM